MTKHSDWSDWDRWCDARIAAALAERDRIHIETTGIALAKIRKQLRAEFVEQLGQLRAELTIQRAHESGRVLDMPNPLVRRRRDVA